MVHKGYGFIYCEDTDSDVFVHHFDITKYNPDKFNKSFAQGEAVQLDVVMSVKICHRLQT